MDLFSGVNQWKRSVMLLLLFCLLPGFALRYYTFDKKSLWTDEIYTLEESRDSLNGQLEFHKQNPTFLHAPLFYLLTHLFYPFPKPERDLRIIPLIFGTLSIPMIYLLSRSFSLGIAFPCTLSLTLMIYHTSLSQEGLSYALLMFLAMVGLYLFMKYLKTQRQGYLLLVVLVFATLFHTSYTTVPFLIFPRPSGCIK